MASAEKGKQPSPTSDDDVPYLTEDEINRFLDDLDHNKDGAIDYAEVEQKLDAAHDELVPQPQEHHFLRRQVPVKPPSAGAADGEKNGNDGKEGKPAPDLEAAPHNTQADRLRHQFLRSIIGSDAQRIPRAEFAERVRQWKIPSLEKEKKQEHDQKAYMRKMPLTRRLRAHWAVNGPEIAFIALVVSMQLALGIWQCVKYATGQQYRAAFGWGVVLAKLCAGALYPTFFFLILSMSRYFSTFLRRSYYISRFINFDFSQKFHIRISIVAVCLATLHAIGHLTGSFNHGSRPENEQAVAALLGPDAVPRPYWRYMASLPGYTGITALGLFYILGALSIPQVRKWKYEIFQLGHLLMFPIIALLMAHGTAGLLQWPMLGYWLAFPTLLVLVERVTRFGVGLHRIKAKLRILDDETVEIKVVIPSERLWKYKAGQYVFLQVPKLSYFQWHPFTVSTCNGKKMSLHIKTDGNWTSRLRGLAGDGDVAEIDVGINGPFGAPAQKFYDFNHTIIVGAGIGVTPFSGVLADLQRREDKLHGGPKHRHGPHHHDRHEAASSSSDSESNAEKAQPTPVTEKPTHQEANHDGPSHAPAAAAPGNSSSTPNPPHPADTTKRFADDYRRVDFHWMVRERNYLLWLSDLLNSVYRSQEWHNAHDPVPHLDIRISTYVTAKRRNIITHVYRWLLELHRTAEHPASPLTGLLNKTQFGRPDFAAALEEHYEDMKRFRAVKREERLARRAADDARSATSSSASSGDPGEEEDEELKVGVFYCGTPVVGEILADQCQLLSAKGRADGSKIEYHFMMEVFG